MPGEFHELFEEFSMYRHTEDPGFSEYKGTENIFCRFALDFGPGIGRFEYGRILVEYENYLATTKLILRC